MDTAPYTRDNIMKVLKAFLHFALPSQEIAGWDIKPWNEEMTLRVCWIEMKRSVFRFTAQVYGGGLSTSHQEVKLPDVNMLNVRFS